MHLVRLMCTLGSGSYLSPSCFEVTLHGTVYVRHWTNLSRLLDRFASAFEAPDGLLTAKPNPAPLCRVLPRRALFSLPHNNHQELPKLLARRERLLLVQLLHWSEIDVQGGESGFMHCQSPSEVGELKAFLWRPDDLGECNGTRKQHIL